jgi:hypothetical protein
MSASHPGVPFSPSAALVPSSTSWLVVQAEDDMLAARKEVNTLHRYGLAMMKVVHLTTTLQAPIPEQRQEGEAGRGAEREAGQQDGGNIPCIQ